MFKHNLGHTAKDKITGFVGVITARVDYLTGCNRYHLQPRELKDGKPVEGIYFDEDQIEVAKKATLNVADFSSERPGACSPDPVK